MKNKERLDVLLVSRGLAESRTKAQALIMSGQVYVDNQKADKAGASFAQDAAIEVRGDACPYVSRGGLKLAKALRDPPAMCAATQAPPPAASPIASCSTGRQRYLPLMWAMASWPGPSGPTLGL